MFWHIIKIFDLHTNIVFFIQLKVLNCVKHSICIWNQKGHWCKHGSTVVAFVAP